MTFITASLIILWIIVLLLIIAMIGIGKQLGAAVRDILSQMIPAKSGPKPGESAEDLLGKFREPKDVGTVEGKFSVVLLVSATCQSCQALSVLIHKIAQQSNLKSKLYALVQLSSHQDKSKDMIRRFEQSHVNTATVVQDGLYKEFGVKEVPMALLIGENKILGKYVASYDSVNNLCMSPEQYVSL